MSTVLLEAIDRAKAFAQIAHKGQFRKNTKSPIPYFTHPQAVADTIAGDRIGNKYGNITLATSVSDTVKHMALIVAYLHDVFEDCHDKGPEYELTPENIEKILGLTEDFSFTQEIYRALVAITRKGDETYTMFIKRVSKNHIATIVKLADLQHNCSDLPDGAKKDKYELAYAILLNFFE